MKIKTKISIILLFSCVLSVNLFGQIKIGITNGLSCVPCSYIMENVVSLQNLDLNFVQKNNSKDLAESILKGKLDIAFLPVNQAVEIVNFQPETYLICGITQQGGISLVSKNVVQDFKELKGKNVYIAEKSSFCDILFKYFLDAYQIEWEEKSENNNPESVILNYSVKIEYLPAMMSNGSVEYAVLPEPAATVALELSKDFNASIDFQYEFRKLNPLSENFVETAMVCTLNFAEKHNQALNQFRELYQEAVVVAKDTPEEIALLSSMHGFKVSQSILEKSIKKANFVFFPGNESVSRVETIMKIFADYFPDKAGFVVPNEECFY